MRLPPLGPLRERARERLGELADALIPKAVTAPPELDRRANNGNGNNKSNGNGNGKGNNGNANGVGNGNGNGNSKTSSAPAVSEPASPAATPPVAATPPGTTAVDAGSGSGNGGGAAPTPANAAPPTSAADIGGSTPTQINAPGGTSPVVQGQSADPADPQPTAGGAVADATQGGSRPSPSTVVGASPAATTSGAFNGNGVSSTNWNGLTGGEGASYGSGDIGTGGTPGDNGSGGGSSKSMPGIVGGLVAALVLLLLLLALLLYKYRYKRRVQDFLTRFTPFKMAPYTQLEKKRSSMGEDLFTDYCRSESRVAKTTASSIGTSRPFNPPRPVSPLVSFNTTPPLASANTSPPLASFNSTAPLPPLNAPGSLASYNPTPPLPPFNTPEPLISFNTTPPLTPLIPSPQLAARASTKFPTLLPTFQAAPAPLIPIQHPAPTATSPLHRRPSADSILSTASSDIFSLLPATTHTAAAAGATDAATRRSSRDSLASNASVASSGIFSPSMLSWPMPRPSTTTTVSGMGSVAAVSPPPTRGSSVKSLEGLAARYKPLTPTKVGPPMVMTGEPMPGGMPVPPAQVVGGQHVGRLLD